MKPTKMRNRLIYKASHVVQSSQLGSTLSDDLRKRYGKRSVRVTKGDHVSIQRGEYKGVDGKVTVVLPDKQYVAIEGIKKEKTKGDKFDVHIHTSNLMVTSLNTDDKWRMKVLHRGQDESSVKKDEGTVPESDNVTDVPTKAAKPEVAKAAKPAKPAKPEEAVTVPPPAEAAKPEEAVTVPPPAEAAKPEEAVTVPPPAEAAKPEEAVTVPPPAEAAKPEEAVTVPPPAEAAKLKVAKPAKPEEAVTVPPAEESGKDAEAPKEKEDVKE